jgi:hypothetical protein
MTEASRTEGLPSDSAEQRDAEDWLIARLEAELHVLLQRHEAPSPAVTGVELDGFLLSKTPILCEAWAHVGAPKPAQKNKVLADALKLVWVEKECFQDGADKYLLFGDQTAARHFTESAWASRALAKLGVEVKVYEFDEDRRRRLLEAQHRQGEKFAGHQRPRTWPLELGRR